MTNSSSESFHLRIPDETFHFERSFLRLTYIRYWLRFSKPGVFRHIVIESCLSCRWNRIKIRFCIFILLQAVSKRYNRFLRGISYKDPQLSFKDMSDQKINPQAFPLFLICLYTEVLRIFWMGITVYSCLFGAMLILFKLISEQSSTQINTNIGMV